MPDPTHRRGFNVYLQEFLAVGKKQETQTFFVVSSEEKSIDHTTDEQ